MRESTVSESQETTRETGRKMGGIDTPKNGNMENLEREDKMNE